MGHYAELGEAFERNEMMAKSRYADLRDTAHQYDLGLNLQAKVPVSDDPVNHPKHYKKGNKECIDVIKDSLTEEEFKGYLKGCNIKYMWRYEYKGKPLEDLDKAAWYLGKLKDRVIYGKSGS